MAGASEEGPSPRRSKVTGEAGETDTGAGTWGPTSKPSLPPSAGRETRKILCQCFSPARHSSGWECSSAAPPQGTPAFTAGQRHSQVTAQHTHRTSHGAESKVCRVQLASPARGRVPGPTRPVLPGSQKQGGRTEKLTPSRFRHMFPRPAEHL